MTGKQRLAKLTVQMVSTEKSTNFIFKCVCTIPMAFCKKIIEFIQSTPNERIDRLLMLLYGKNYVEVCEISF